MTKQKQQKISPPALLRGLFTTTVAITAAILLLAWGIIQYQVEQLVAKRTSEYAHSIAKIAANSSADALLSGDKIQLKMLVENVAKDPYVKSATIYAEDGQVVAQSPEPLLEVPAQENEKEKVTAPPVATLDDESLLDNLEDALSIGETQMVSRRTKAFIQAQDDIPFIEKIVYQQVTAGWFKVSLNRQLLESSFRQSLHISQKLIAGIAGILFVLLMVIHLRFEKRVKNLIAICHRLIQVNTEPLPKEKSQWMDSLKELSETRFQSLAEHPHQLPQQQSSWSSAQQTSNTVFCYCEFTIHQPEQENTADSLTQAEHYLMSAIQAHGLQSQGDILSGCLIPFLESNDVDEGLIEIMTLVHTVRECLASLDIKLSMRALIAQGALLLLEDEHGVIKGITLTQRLRHKFNKLAPITTNDATVCIAFEAEQLESLGTFSVINLSDSDIMAPIYQLNNLSEPLKQQIQRQINYIMANNS